MCYSHVMTNVHKYKYNSKEYKEQIKNDLRQLHLSPEKETFEVGCKLFVEKWRPMEKGALRKINKSFIKKNFNWYIGAQVRAPTTNNATESFNASMKKFHTYHEKKNH